MSQLFEYIKIALMNIKNNKGRSILTMLGIIIGISLRKKKDAAEGKRDGK